jgi:transcription elongation factor Elf1
MAKYSTSFNCTCGNSISVDTAHHTGGVNDRDVVTLVCAKCGEKHQTDIENIELARISGATRSE